MKNKIYILLVAFTVLCIKPVTLSAQSWNQTTYQFIDTIGKYSSKCIYDNSGNSYWASQYYELTNFTGGYWIWKADVNGNKIASSRVVLSSNLWTQYPIKDMKIIDNNLFIMFDAIYQSSDNDVFVLKYNSSLIKQWETFFNGASNPDDVGLNITAGPNQSLIVGGQSGNIPFISKIKRSNGTPIHTAVFGNGSTTQTMGQLQVYNNYIYLSGSTNNVTLPNSYNSFITKLDSNLTNVWTTNYDASQSGYADGINTMTFNSAGQIVTAGSFAKSTGIRYGFYLKADTAAGNILWEYKMSNANTSVLAVANDASSNIVSLVSGTPLRFVKLNTGGGLILNKTIFTDPNIVYTPRIIEKGGYNLYAMGTYDTTVFVGGIPDHRYGILISKFNGSGTRLWERSFLTYRPDLEYTLGSLIVKNSSSVYYSVNTQDISLLPKEYTINFGVINATTGLRIGDENNLDATESKSTISIYPNPAKERIQINVKDNRDEESNITIFDVRGKIVSESKQNFGNDNSILQLSVSTFSSGIYFVKVENSENVYTSKFVKTEN